MSQIDKLITELEEREGGAAVIVDQGGRTQFGISEKANPQAWLDGKVTEDEARSIYEQKYVVGPGFNLVKDQALMVQLVDFGVNSGPGLAVMKLQTILRVKVDGVLGKGTIDALGKLDAKRVNNELVKARVTMLANLVAKDASYRSQIVGLVSRALQFLV